MAASSTTRSYLLVQTENDIESGGCGILTIAWMVNLDRKRQPWWGFFEFTPEELSQSSDWRLPWDYVPEDEVKYSHLKIVVPLSFLLSSAAERFTVRLFRSGSPPYQLCCESRVIRAKEFIDFETQRPSLQLAWKNAQLVIGATWPPGALTQVKGHNCSPLQLTLKIADADGSVYHSHPLVEGGVTFAPRRDLRAGANTIQLASTFQHLETVLETIEAEVDASFQLNMRDRGLPSLFDLSLRVVSHQLLPMLFGRRDAAASSSSFDEDTMITSLPSDSQTPNFCFFAHVESQSLNKLAEQGLWKLTAKKFMQLFHATDLTSLTLPGHRFGGNLLGWTATLQRLTTLCITEPKDQHLDPSLLAKLSSLQSLSLQQMWTDVTSELWLALAQLTNLRELYLTSTFSAAVDATVVFVPATVEVFSRLVAFELSGFHDPTTKEETFWDHLLATPNPHLVTLSANMSQFRDCNAAVLPERFPNLVRFSANYSKISPAAFHSFLALKGLESLALSFSTGFDSHCALEPHVAELRALAERLSTFYCRSAFHNAEWMHKLEIACQAEGRAVQLCSVYWKIVADPANPLRRIPIFKRICAPNVSVNNDWVGLYPSRETSDDKWGEWSYLRDAPKTPPAGIELLPGEVCLNSFAVASPKYEFRYFKGNTHLQGVCLAAPTGV